MTPYEPREEPRLAARSSDTPRTLTTLGERTRDQSLGYSELAVGLPATSLRGRLASTIGRTARTSPCHVINRRHRQLAMTRRSAASASRSLVSFFGRPRSDYRTRHSKVEPPELRATRREFPLSCVFLKRRDGSGSLAPPSRTTLRLRIRRSRSVGGFVRARERINRKQIRRCSEKRRRRSVLADGTWRDIWETRRSWKDLGGFLEQRGR